jgi:endonuclease/exonuclease/phosphatase family metal-dependent hydrolase
MPRLHLAEALFALAAVGLAVAGILLAGGGAADPFAPGSKPIDGLRVVSWNLGSGSEQPLPARDENIPHIATVLEDLDGDLVFLQELTGLEQGRRLAGFLGAGWSVVSGAGGLALAYREGRIAVAARGRSGWKRMVFTYQKGEQPPVRAANLHADMLSSRRRNRLIGGVTDLLASQKWAILAGDLNLDVDFRKRGDLFTDNLHRDLETYNYLADRMQDVGMQSGSTAEPDRRLDYIFTSKSGFEVRMAGPWKGKRGGGMDHDPLVADLEFLDK